MMLEGFNTKGDLDSLLSSIERFKLDLFNYNTDELEKKLHYEYDIKFTSVLRNLLSQNNIELNEDSKIQVEEVLNAWEKQASEVEVLEMTIAFSPTERFLDEIKHWISKNVSENTLLDLKVRNKLIGGAELVYKGKYKDLTISNKLENYEFNVQL